MVAAMASSAEATATVPALEVHEVVTQAVATGERPIPRSDSSTRKDKTVQNRQNRNSSLQI